jgi:hypothetical protein
MPAPWVYEASDGVLVVYNGVTRATRIARLAPGATIRVELVGKLRRAYAGSPRSETKCHVPATQHELIEKLTDLQQLSPNIRFGQLLANLGFLVEDQTDQSLWDVEDARLLEVMEKHRVDLLQRQPTVA